MRDHMYYVVAKSVDFNSGGILTWIQDNIVVVVLAVIGVVILMGSGKGNYSKVASTGGIVLIGLVFIFVPTLLIGFAQGFSHTVFK